MPCAISLRMRPAYRIEHRLKEIDAAYQGEQGSEGRDAAARQDRIVEHHRVERSAENQRVQRDTQQRDDAESGAVAREHSAERGPGRRGEMVRTWRKSCGPRRKDTEGSARRRPPIFPPIAER